MQVLAERGVQCGDGGDPRSLLGVYFLLPVNDTNVESLIAACCNFISNPDRSRELVSGSGLCFIVFCRMISGGGFAGWVVLGARVGVVRLVGAVLWRGSGCGGARGESFGGGWGRRAVAGVYGAPGLQACSSCAVAGHQSSRRRVHFLEERTSRAGACHSCHLRRLGAA